MGCFSFMCKECGEAILSNSFRGQQVELFLLKNGVVIEHMGGEYDSYGRVFKPDFSDSIYWDMDWDDVVDLMFHQNESNGIAAIHTKCFRDSMPTTRSEDDPNQGWGEDSEYLEDTREDRETP